MHLSKARSMVHPGMCHEWYGEFLAFMDHYHAGDVDIWDCPDRWYNCDETGFPMCPKTGKILCAKDAKNPYTITSSDKSQITVMACLSAGGNFMEPMIVFPQERFNFNPLAGFRNACIGRSSNGWMDSELFLEWLGLFSKHLDDLQVKRPVLLFCDGHKTHLTEDASLFCRANDIILYCLLENSSHLMQPCDLRFFSSLKANWKTAVMDFQDQNIGEVVTKMSLQQSSPKLGRQPQSPIWHPKASG